MTIDVLSQPTGRILPVGLMVFGTYFKPAALPFKSPVGVCQVLEYAGDGRFACLYFPDWTSDPKRFSLSSKERREVVEVRRESRS